MTTKAHVDLVKWHVFHRDGTNEIVEAQEIKMDRGGITFVDGKTLIGVAPGQWKQVHKVGSATPCLCEKSK